MEHIVILKPKTTEVNVVDAVNIDEVCTVSYFDSISDMLISGALIFGIGKHNIKCIYIHHGIAEQMQITASELVSTIYDLKVATRLVYIVDLMTPELLFQLQSNSMLFSFFKSDSVYLKTMLSSEYDNQVIVSPTVHESASKTCVYFKQNTTKMGISRIASYVLNRFNYNLTYETNWNNLSAVISREPDMLWIHMDMIPPGSTIAELIDVIETFKRLNNIEKRCIVCITITPNATADDIKQLQRAGINGIVPCRKTFSLRDSLMALDQLMRGQPYWPQHIISQLSFDITKDDILPNTNSACARTIALTSRQEEIYNLIINRGLNNKQIARTLNISDGTVKIHVGKLLKAIGVRNRTQLLLAKM